MSSPAKRIYILTGGTVVHVTPHFALCAPAYGTVGIEIADRLAHRLLGTIPDGNHEIVLVKTKMAGANSSATMARLALLGIHATPETNADAQAFVQAVLADAQAVALIMAAAICDFSPIDLTAVGKSGHITTMQHFGKEQKRLHHIETLTLQMRPSDKIIDGIKRVRPDLMVVTFKTTAGVTADELFSQAFYNLQKSQSDLVFANDIQNYQRLIYGKCEHLSGFGNLTGVAGRNLTLSVDERLSKYGGDSHR
ncbi:MAG: hypothetical protein DYG89_40315 [Caldilinea sp. CFX5]|nr:hypothetical protein [Caldilinea sp. CFX5]